MLGVDALSEYWSDGAVELRDPVEFARRPGSARPAISMNEAQLRQEIANAINEQKRGGCRRQLRALFDGVDIGPM
eukprot:9480013-Pyramimonas_sp.AAC.1